MSTIICEFCFAQFSDPSAADAETVECPECGEQTSAVMDDSAVVADDSGTADTGENDSDDGDVWIDKESGESDSGLYELPNDSEEETYGLGEVEIAGEVISDNDEAPENVPVRRKKKKTGKRRKKKKAAPDTSGNAVAEAIDKVIHAVSGYPKVIVGVLIWVVFIILFTSGTFESREQQLFHNMTGESRTTAEWLTVVRSYEEQTAEGEISDRAKSLYLKISKGINVFIGADPAAIPDLFEALKEDPKQSRLPRIAESALTKFNTDAEKPLISDLEDGLESGHPKVILWSIRLLAMHGPDASDYADAVEEFTKSEDSEIAAAASETLSRIK